MTILGELSAEFGWAPDAWRRLTWRELTAWIGELGRRRQEQHDAEAAAQQRADMERQRAEFRRQHGIR